MGNLGPFYRRDGAVWHIIVQSASGVSHCNYCSSLKTGHGATLLGIRLRLASDRPLMIQLEAPGQTYEQTQFTTQNISRFWLFPARRRCTWVGASPCFTAVTRGFDLCTSVRLPRATIDRRSENDGPPRIGTSQHSARPTRQAPQSVRHRVVADMNGCACAAVVSQAGPTQDARSADEG